MWKLSIVLQQHLTVFTVAVSHLSCKNWKGCEWSLSYLCADMWCYDPQSSVCFVLGHINSVKVGHAKPQASRARWSTIITAVCKLIASTTCLHHPQMSTFTDGAKMWQVEMTGLQKSSRAILQVIFCNPMGMASVCIDSWKLYNVMTKLAKMKLAAVVLALWGLHAKNCSKPIQENDKLSRDSIFFFFCFLFLFCRNKTLNEVVSWQQAEI